MLSQRQLWMAAVESLLFMQEMLDLLGAAPESLNLALEHP